MSTWSCQGAWRSPRHSGRPGLGSCHQPDPRQKPVESIHGPENRPHGPPGGGHHAVQRSHDIQPHGLSHPGRAGFLTVTAYPIDSFAPSARLRALAP